MTTVKMADGSILVSCENWNRRFLLLRRRYSWWTQFSVCMRWTARSAPSRRRCARRSAHPRSFIALEPMPGNSFDPKNRSVCWQSI